jgi:NADH:ubiquinone oxidoreductase subunit C
MDEETLLGSVTRLSTAVALVERKANHSAVQVPVEKLEGVLRQLRDDEALAFDQLLTHTAVDWMETGRLELLYILFSTQYGHTLLVSSLVSRDNPIAPTASGLWRIAEWQEREVYDLFGVQYDGHQDLRRLFLEDDWVGHPLRKDYTDEFMLVK